MYWKITEISLVKRTVLNLNFTEIIFDRHALYREQKLILQWVLTIFEKWHFFLDASSTSSMMKCLFMDMKRDRNI